MMFLLFALTVTPLHADPPQGLTDAWRSHPVWHDGQAEQADYRATRMIYGQPRDYTARLFTNKEMYNARTTTKAAGRGDIEVFKFHQRHDVPTTNYTYHFSTMSYVATTNLMSVKLEMGSQEDCGATFKRFVNRNATLNWMQSSYFPREGLKQGQVDVPEQFVFADALPLVLRGYPFDDPREITLQVLPNQTDTHLTDVEPVPMVVSYVERRTMQLPVGEVDTHVLRVVPASQRGAPVATRSELRLGFAANGGKSNDGPGLHVMVYLKSTDGVEMRLERQRRWAYWAN